MTIRILGATVVTVAALAALALSAILVPASISPSIAAAQPAPGKRLPRDEVGRAHGRDILRINNRSPFLVNVFIAGVRVGWMRPYRVGVIRGLVHGTHQIYAHTQYGTVAWGPRELWVPGTWNLIY